MSKVWCWRIIVTWRRNRSAEMNVLPFYPLPRSSQCPLAAPMAEDERQHQSRPNTSQQWFYTSSRRWGPTTRPRRV